MSSDLHDLFKRELREIPVPPPERWAPSTPRSTKRPRAERWILSAFVVAAVVVASILGGELLARVRGQFAASPSTNTGLPSFQRGDDLVYLAESDLGQGFFQEVLMPEGTVQSRLVGRGVVGSLVSRYVMRTGDDLALLPVWQDGGRPAGMADTYLQAVTLHSGAPTFRISTGPVHLATGPANSGPEVAGPFVEEAAVGADGSSVFVVRDIGPSAQSTELVRYSTQFDPKTDVSPFNLGRILASRTWGASPAGRGDLRGDPIWSRIIPLDGGRVALVRQHVKGTDLTGRAYQGQQDWYFLDSDLRELASYIGPGPGMFSPTGECSFDPVRLPNDEWAIICADPSGAADGPVVHFLSGRDFHILDSVATKAWGYPLGATVAGGTLEVLMGGPVVLRFDVATHRLMDARRVTQASILDLLMPSAALAKERGAPTIQFTPDGRFAYVAEDRGAWWGGLAVIDLEHATLVAHSTAIGDTVLALRLAADGHRVYALITDSDGKTTTLALVDPATLKVVQRSTSLSNAPSAIIAVAERR